MLKNIFYAVFVASQCVVAREFYIQPYLQDAEPNSIVVMWESKEPFDSVIYWGTGTNLNRVSEGTHFESSGKQWIHTVKISGLTPSTHYFYSTSQDGKTDAVFDFVTPPDPTKEGEFSFLSTSDVQICKSKPFVFKTMCLKNIPEFLGTNDMNAAGVRFLMIPGDLVNEGPDYEEWERTFFSSAESLISHIPVYPVTGNHERDHQNYFDYFHLPENGTEGYMEHWWYKDFSNIRIIGLDSNPKYRIDGQLEWLEKVLEKTADNPDIDFVFTQLHHPHESELWPRGNADFTGEVIAVLEAFSAKTDKASVILYGHTHGYSHGNSKDHRHMMFNVGGGGGCLDGWGTSNNQLDYKKYLNSLDEHGFMYVSVENSEDPSFVIRWITRGKEAEGENVLFDEVHFRANNKAPAQPSSVAPLSGVVAPESLTLKASAFSDPDSSLQGASHWQISLSPDFSEVVYDNWMQFQNIFNKIDLNKTLSLTEHIIPILDIPAGQKCYWRVRYRDRELAWSGWSDPAEFTVSKSSLGSNLLNNPGAENGLEGWKVDGALALLSKSQLGIKPHSGADAFNLSAKRKVKTKKRKKSYSCFSQTVELPADAEGYVYFGGVLNNSLRENLGSIHLQFLDAEGKEISTSRKHGNLYAGWNKISQRQSIPPSAQAVRFVLEGKNPKGATQNLFDDLYLKVPEKGKQAEVRDTEDSP